MCHRYESIIATLCENLDTLDEPEAKASMIWIIGEYAERIDNADELLEQFLETFPEETALVQLQLVTAAVKLFLKKPTEKPQQMIQLVLTYATQVTWTGPSHASSPPVVRHLFHSRKVSPVLQRSAQQQQCLALLASTVLATVGCSSGQSLAGYSFGLCPPVQCRMIRFASFAQLSRDVPPSDPCFDR